MIVLLNTLYIACVAHAFNDGPKIIKLIDQTVICRLIYQI